MSVFGHRWPGPSGRVAPTAAVSVLAAAVIAAFGLPLDSGGLGWLLTTLAAAAAVTQIRLTRPRPPAFFRLSSPADPLKPVWALATVALIGVGTLRAAGWLFVLCLLAAMTTGAVAVAGGRSARAMLRSVAMATGAGFRGLRWLSRGVGRRSVNGLRVSLTILVSVLLLLLFGALFASADETFARVVQAATPQADAGSAFRWVVVGTIALFVLSGVAYLAAAPPDQRELGTVRPARVGRLEWVFPLGLLTTLFAAFVAVQLTVLFGGARHVLQTDGLTYAQFARGGFWQLLAITGLTLLVLAGAARWAPRDTVADRTLIRAILGTLAVLTLVIVASALHRMTVYADTYGLTRLRLLVALCELWLGVVFLLVLAAGIRLRAAWLPRAVLGSAVLALLGLAAINPDALIAEHNVARYERTGRIDLGYLTELSADAVPELNRLPSPLRCQALSGPFDTGGDWRSWSLGRAEARDLLRHAPTCD